MIRRLIMGRKKAEPIPKAIPVPPPLPDRTSEVLSMIRAESEAIASGHGNILRCLDAMRRDHAQAESVLRDSINSIVAGISNRDTVEGLRAKANCENTAAICETFNGAIEEFRQLRVDVATVEDRIAEIAANDDLRFKILAEQLATPHRIKISLPEGMTIARKPK